MEEEVVEDIDDAHSSESGGRKDGPVPRTLLFPGLVLLNQAWADIAWGRHVDALMELHPAGELIDDWQWRGRSAFIADWLARHVGGPQPSGFGI